MIYQRQHPLHHRDTQRALMPVVNDRQRDPWTPPALAFVALIVAYFVWEYLR